MCEGERESVCERKRMRDIERERDREINREWESEDGVNNIANLFYWYIRNISG